MSLARLVVSKNSSAFFEQKKISQPVNHMLEVFSEIAKADEYRIRNGLEPVINLGIGAPHLPVPKIVLESVSEELKNGGLESKFGYSPSQGRDESIAAAIKLYEKYYPKAKYSKDELMITMGATGALDNAFAILLQKNRGDEVLVFQPFYSFYIDNVIEHNAKLIMIPTDDNHFRPSALKLDRYLREHPKAKVVVLNYPNNPSGIDLSKTEMASIAMVLNKYPDVAIIFDDVYRDFTDQEHVTPVDIDPKLKDRCIMINSASKGLFGGPDLRVGFAGAKADWIKQMSEKQMKTIISVSLLQQLALVKTIDFKISQHPEYVAWLNKTKNEYRDNVNYFSIALNDIGFNSLDIRYGRSGFYVLSSAKFLIGRPIPDPELRKRLGHDKFLTDCDIAAYLAYNAGVAAIPGSVFGIDGCEGYFRFSCAQPLHLLKKAIKCMEETFIKDKLLIPEDIDSPTFEMQLK